MAQSFDSDSIFDEVIDHHKVDDQHKDQSHVTVYPSLLASLHSFQSEALSIDPQEYSHADLASRRNWKWCLRPAELLTREVDPSQYTPINLHDWSLLTPPHTASMVSSASPEPYDPAPSSRASYLSEGRLEQHQRSEGFVLSQVVSSAARSRTGQHGLTPPSYAPVTHSGHPIGDLYHITEDNYSLALAEQHAAPSPGEYVKMEDFIRIPGPPLNEFQSIFATPDTVMSHCTTLKRETSAEGGESECRDSLAKRKDRDELLLALRNQGLRYKDIKRQGRFTEAESTLRGRVRMLTKPKEHRVRKPSWLPQDDCLLRRAVRKFEQDEAASGKRRKASIPWKKVSEWMLENGASYEFASATCAKQWSTINGL